MTDFDDTFDPVRFHRPPHRDRRWETPEPAPAPARKATVHCLDCRRPARPNPECRDALCASCLAELAGEGGEARGKAA